MPTAVSQQTIKNQLSEIDREIFALEREIEQAIKSGTIPGDFILPTEEELERRTTTRGWNTGIEFIRTGNDGKLYLANYPGFDSRALRGRGLKDWYNAMLRLEALRAEREQLCNTADPPSRPDFIEALESALVGYSQSLQEWTNKLYLIYGSEKAFNMPYSLGLNHDGIFLQRGYSDHLATLLGNFHFNRSKIIQSLNGSGEFPVAVCKRLLELASEITKALAAAAPNYNEDLDQWVTDSPLWLRVGAIGMLEPTMEGFLTPEVGCNLERLRHSFTAILAGHAEQHPSVQAGSSNGQSGADLKNEKEQQNTSERLPSKIGMPKAISTFPSPKDLSWEQVEISFQSDASIKVTAAGITKRYSYSQIGFADSRTSDTPTKAWRLLRCLAEYEGRIPWKNNVPNDLMKNASKRVEEIRERLRNLMRLTEDPFHPYDNSLWIPKFKILSVNKSEKSDTAETQRDDDDIHGNDIEEVYADEIASHKDQISPYNTRNTAQTRLDEPDEY